MTTIRTMLRITLALLITLTLTFNITSAAPVQAQTTGATRWPEIKASLPATITDAQQAYLKSSNTNLGSYFGDAIAMDGDTLVVGSYEESSNATDVDGDQLNHLAPYSGAVYVFIRTGNTWSQQAYLKASNTNASDYFGHSVAISGDTIVVGAYGEDSNATGVNGNQADNSALVSGAAYVFTRTGNTWSQQAYLKASNTNASDRFGSSVAISADSIIVGAPFENGSSSGVNGNQTDYTACNSGAAYVFTRSGITWSQQAYLKSSNNDENCYSGNYDYFGTSVTISGDTIAVGNPFEDSSATGVNGDQMNDNAVDSGAAYVFTRSGSDWSQQAYLKASNTHGYNHTDEPDNFGKSISIAGDTIVVGAPGEDSDATGINGNQTNSEMYSSGAAYVFVRSGINWSQQAYLKASITDAGDRFGTSVAIAGDIIVAGAPGEDSIATGVNGDQADNTSDGTGAAYSFVRSGNTWGQSAYIKASNTPSTPDAGDPEDAFGETVAVSANTILVGAPAEDSNDIGVNGDQTNNSAESAGAAYVFVLPPLVAFSQPANPSPTTATSVDFTVAFSEAVSNVSMADFMLTTTGAIANASITNISGGPTNYTVTVDTGTGDGTIRLDVLDNDTILNVNSIPLGGTGTGNGSFNRGKSYTIDRTAPIVSSITLIDPNPTSLNNAAFTVTFSEPVIGVDMADFVLTTSGVTNAAITGVSGADAAYTVTVKTGHGNGTIRLDMPVTAAFTDPTGNTPGNLPYTSGASYTVKKILTVTSIGAFDGWILESSETSGVGGTLNGTATTFLLGDSALNQQYRAILHFNTSALPDTAIITKATLKINKTGVVVGGNPFTTLGALIVDLSNPFFGSSSALQLSDFKGSAQVGKFGAPVSNWYSAILDGNGRTYINRTGATQFRLRFTKDDDNDHIADYVKFYSGNFGKDAYRPTLVIEYYVP